MAKKDPWAHKGVTPWFIVNTEDLQEKTPTVGSVFDGVGMTTANSGICAALVSFWLNRLRDDDPVDSPDDFPSKFHLSIAQASYEMGSDLDASREAMLDRFAVSIVSRKDRHNKWYTFKETKIEEAVGQACEAPGFYYLAISGSGRGHALGISTKDVIQFFDANWGIWQFADLNDLRNWVPSHIVKKYPKLLRRAKLFGVG